MTPPTNVPTGAISPAETEQWQSIFDTLEDAARACDALGDQAINSDDVFGWRRDALMVINTADSLRFALQLQLPYSLPPESMSDATAGDPVKLLEKAWTLLEDMPDDLDNLPLLLARFEVADVLAAVRTPHE